MTRDAPWNRIRDRGANAAESFREWLLWIESPLSTYYLILTATALLMGLGLIMVLSASSIMAYERTHSAFTMFRNQFIYAVLGVAVAYVISRMPVAFIKRFAFVGFVIAAFLQSLVMVPHIGVSVQGHRSWIGRGNLVMQPSELGKIALILVVAFVVSKRRAYLNEFKRGILPTLIYVGLLVALIMLGHDLGTAMVVVAIYIGMMWVAGVPGRWFGWMLAAGALLLPIAVFGSGNRTSRVGSWLSTCSTHSISQGCWQKVQGSYALADGGIWGLGLGASRAKWGYLPEAQNDFIYSVVGEELGLPGTLAILGLFIVLAYACFRLIARSDDPFIRVATGGIMSWFCAQAMINIASVLGLFPIIGVPLPFVSAGGTALVMALMGIGLLLAFARADPQARHALAARPHGVSRMVSSLPRRKASS